jgi:hypothetical protein
MTCGAARRKEKRNPAFHLYERRDIKAKITTLMAFNTTNCLIILFLCVSFVVVGSVASGVFMRMPLILLPFSGK